MSISVSGCTARLEIIIRSVNVFHASVARHTGSKLMKPTETRKKEKRRHEKAVGEFADIEIIPGAEITGRACASAGGARPLTNRGLLALSLASFFYLEMTKQPRKVEITSAVCIRLRWNNKSDEENEQRREEGREVDEKRGAKENARGKAGTGSRLFRVINLLYIKSNCFEPLDVARLDCGACILHGGAFPGKIRFSLLVYLLTRSKL